MLRTSFWAENEAIFLLLSLFLLSFCHFIRIIQFDCVIYVVFYIDWFLVVV